MIATFGVFYWRSGRIEDQEAALNMCRLIVVSTYFYSGLQKINSDFALYVLPRLFGGSETTAFPFRALAILPPFAEAALGVGLLTRRLRNLSVVAATAMHGFVLLSIGPFGSNSNSVVWPWNLAMIAFFYLLFWKTRFSFAEIIWNNQFAFQKVLLLLVIIMPLFSFCGWWDSYLSWSLYSGNVDGGNIFVNTAVADQLPDYLHGYITHLSGNNSRLDIYDWSVGELNVPPYPEARIFRELGADICHLSHNSADVAFICPQEDNVAWRRRADPRYMLWNAGRPMTKFLDTIC
jgi:hypothetical protein